jgi:4-hydroxymandelate oxidase
MSQTAPGLPSLAEAARAVLAPEVFHYYATGSGSGQTAAAEEAAWAGVRLRPRVMRDVSRVSTVTSVLGATVATPVLVAPSAAHVLAHPDGETATAAATAAAGSLLVLSLRASRRLEDVAAALGPTGSWWQQIYVLRDRGVSDEVARRAAEAGARALVLTVDAPYVARKPGLAGPLLPPTGIVAALDGRDWSDDSLKQAPDLGPADVERLRAVSGLPVVAKGVLRGDEARRCVDAGAAAVVVSTHGGRQLDGVVTVPEALPEVADALAGTGAEVYADGGVRNGRDVLRALALGARAVMVGRPVLWGLAVGGAAGVREVLAALAEEVTEAFALAGVPSCAEVGPDLVRAAPAGWRD